MTIQRRGHRSHSRLCLSIISQEPVHQRRAPEETAVCSSPATSVTTPELAPAAPWALNLEPLAPGQPVCVSVSGAARGGGWCGMEAQGTSPSHRADYIPTQEQPHQGLLSRSSGQREMVGPLPGMGLPKEGNCFFF